MPLHPRFTITNAITADLALIERARGFLEAATLSEAWIERMSRNAILLEAHHTTHIEGTQLTVEQSAQLWAGGDVAGVDRDDKRELLNYRSAFDLVAQYLESGQPITENLVRSIHHELVAGVRGGEGGPGSYRSVQNHVGNSVTKEIIYTPPPPHDVAPMMQDLLDWLRDPGDLHPVLAAGIAQFQLVHVHPFLDGNGRTSRLLSALILYRSGYDFKRLFTISEYYDRDRAAFYSAIQSAREQDLDLTGWLEFFVHGLATQLLEVQQRGRVAVTASSVALRHDLNGRQTTLLDEVMARGETGLQTLQTQLPDVNRRTLQRDLAKLSSMGLIAEVGSRTDPNRRYRSNVAEL